MYCTSIEKFPSHSHQASSPPNHPYHTSAAHAHANNRSATSQQLTKAGTPSDESLHLIQKTNNTTITKTTKWAREQRVPRRTFLALTLGPIHELRVNDLSR
jgi:hypothetical protein